MRKIKVPTFSFHSEPIWMLFCPLVPAVIGVLIVLFVILIRKIVG